MTVVRETILLLKKRGMWSDKMLIGKDYKPLPKIKKQSKVARQHLPI